MGESWKRQLRRTCDCRPCDSEHSCGCWNPSFRQCGTWGCPSCRGTRLWKIVSTYSAPTDASELTGGNAYISSRRFPCGRRSTRPKQHALVAGTGDFTGTIYATASTGGRRDRGLCGMPREWTVELAGESAIVPTYRNGAAPFGGDRLPKSHQ